MKNSSRLLSKMATNFSRSISGLDSSRASCSKRRLNSSHDSSRLMNSAALSVDGAGGADGAAAPGWSGGTPARPAEPPRPPRVAVAPGEDGLDGLVGLNELDGLAALAAPAGPAGPPGAPAWAGSAYSRARGAPQCSDKR